jgi:excisionase family DNA binding protein
MSSARKFIRASEIVGLTGLSLRTIRRLIKDEVVPSTKLGGARLVATADLDGLLSPLTDLAKDPDDGSK